jgi:uncharacterized membrane protein YkoI
MHKRKTARKRNTIAAIAVSGIMLGGAGFAVAGEVSEGSSTRESAQVRTGAGSGLGSQAASALAVSSVAEATDAVLQQLGDGRVTEVVLAQENGLTVWKVTLDQGNGPTQVTLDATTGEIIDGAGTAPGTGDITSPGDGTGTGTGTGSGSGTGTGSSSDDDSDGDDDSDDEGDDGDDDGDDDDDESEDGEEGGPIREGVTPSK